MVSRDAGELSRLVAERVQLPMQLPFDFRELKRVTIAACGTSLLRRHGRALLVRAVRAACRSKSTSRPSTATASSARPDGALCDLHLAIRRDRRHARHRSATRASTRAACRFDVQSPDIRQSPARATSAADVSRSGDRRGVHQSVYVSLAALSRLRWPPGRARGVLSGPRRKHVGAALDRSAAALRRSAGA